MSTDRQDQADGQTEPDARGPEIPAEHRAPGVERSDWDAFTTEELVTSAYERRPIDMPLDDWPLKQLRRVAEEMIDRRDLETTWFRLCTPAELIFFLNYASRLKSRFFDWEGLFTSEEPDFEAADAFFSSTQEDLDAEILGGGWIGDLEDLPGRIEVLKLERDTTWQKHFRAKERQAAMELQFEKAAQDDPEATNKQKRSNFVERCKQASAAYQQAKTKRYDMKGQANRLGFRIARLEQEMEIRIAKLNQGIHPH